MVKTAKMNCVFCGKQTLYRETYVTLQPGSIRARASQCTSCKEYYMDGAAAQKSLLLNQLQRGIKMKVGELGNSLFLRIPVDAARLLNFKKGKDVITRAVNKNGKLVLEIQPT